jgi:hypothetical protein
MDGACRRKEGIINANNILITKRENVCPLGRPRHTWKYSEDRIWEAVDWIHLAGRIIGLNNKIIIIIIIIIIIMVAELVQSV